MVDFKLLLEKSRKEREKEMAKVKEGNIDDWKPADDEEEVGGDINIWNPAANGKVGDTLVGEVVELEEGTYGVEVKIKDADGEVWTTPAHRVLQTAVEHLNIGDIVRIVFTGHYITPAGHKTKTYKVARKK